MSAVFTGSEMYMCCYGCMQYQVCKPDCRIAINKIMRTGRPLIVGEVQASLQQIFGSRTQHCMSSDVLIRAAKDCVIISAEKRTKKSNMGIK